MDEKLYRLAAIDVGTNSFHLIVVDAKENGKFTILGKEKEVVRLGEGMTDMKHISPEAMIRALETLKRFKLIADSFEAPIRAVATSATREALNKEAFLELVRQNTGIEIEVVSGYEEARLIYLGALQALQIYDKRALVIDIGGGSTEFLLGEEEHIHYANSLKLGAVRLTRRFFQSDETKQSEIEACRQWVIGALNPIERKMEGERYDIAVGSSGTILNLAAVACTMKGRDSAVDEGSVVVTREELRPVFKAILNEPTVDGRKKIPGLDPARADIIVAGAIILMETMDRLGIDSIATSKYALREGIILDTYRKLAGSSVKQEQHLSDVRKTSVYHLAENCRFESEHAESVTKLAMQLFEQTRVLHGLERAELEYLQAASVLHDIGYHISHSQHHKHSYYIIRNSELLGFTDREIEIIANVARYHRKSHPKQKHDAYNSLTKKDQEIVRKLSAILRIADGLDRKHSHTVKSIECEIGRDAVDMILRTADSGEPTLEIWGAERRKGLFEEVFGKDVRFHYSVLLESEAVA
ncbi:MAG: exopolyphosphatase [Ectothiorhodospiraceae bacterium]|nr:exopolyphosphatase [Ectothiorhodospiraceae bacterium]